MSDSYHYEEKCSSHWDKLEAYLLFKIVCEGLWISKDPSFWLEAITDDNMIIKTTLDEDSGGGPLHAFCISVQRRHARSEAPSGEIFSITMVYDEVHSNPTFSHRARAMYDYMKSYASDSRNPTNWFNMAIGNEESELNVHEWNSLFGPLEDTGRLLNSSIPLQKYSSIKLPHAGFRLLSDIQHISEKEISFSGKTAKAIKLCKQWALFALLDMERYYFGTC